MCVASQDADRRLWMKTTNYGMGLVPIFYFRLSNSVIMDERKDIELKSASRMDAL